MSWPENPEPFYVQANPREVWHVETPDDPEEMLCGLMISVDVSVKIQRRSGKKPCLWCRKALADAQSSLASGTS